MPRLTGYVHALHNVVGNRKVDLQIPIAVKEKLNITGPFNEYQLVLGIWNQFHLLTEILLKDPLPGKHPDDMSLEEREAYTWGYSEDDKLNYVSHLFCMRYSAKSVTAYMIKLVDHVPQLMNILPFPVSRFQSEGGEHANYERSSFYHCHTTRHGGRRRNPDPIYALLQASWNRISFEVIQLATSSNAEEREIGNSFMAYCTCHTAAAIIQRCQSVR